MVGVRFYGLVNVPLRKVVEVYATEHDAEIALERVLADEPDWAADLSVHALELEVQEDSMRLRSSSAALIDISYREAPPTGAAEPLALPSKRNAASTRRGPSGSG